MESRFGISQFFEYLLPGTLFVLMIAYGVVMVFAWITYMFYYKQRFPIIVSGYDYYCARNPQEKEIFMKFVNEMEG